MKHILLIFLLVLVVGCIRIEVGGKKSETANPDIGSKLEDTNLVVPKYVEQYTQNLNFCKENCEPDCIANRCGANAFSLRTLSVNANDIPGNVSFEVNYNQDLDISTCEIYFVSDSGEQYNYQPLYEKYSYLYSQDCVGLHPTNSKKQYFTNLSSEMANLSGTFYMIMVHEVFGGTNQVYSATYKWPQTASIYDYSAISYICRENCVADCIHKICKPLQFYISKVSMEKGNITNVTYEIKFLDDFTVKNQCELEFVSQDGTTHTLAKEFSSNYLDDQPCNGFHVSGSKITLWSPLAPTIEDPEGTYYVHLYSQEPDPNSKYRTKRYTASFIWE